MLAGRREPTRPSAWLRLPAAIAASAGVLLSGLALAPPSEGFVYWPNTGVAPWDSFAIGRANPDGSGVNRDFLKLPGIRTDCCVEVTSAGGVAVDASHLYWVSDGLGRASLDGSHASENFIRIRRGSPCDMAVDAEHLYWSYADSDSGIGMIGRANLDGTNVEQSFITTTDQSSCTRFAVGTTHVYWTNADYDVGHAIGRANVDGTGVEQDFLAVPDEPCGVAVDASRLYWGAGTGTIANANLDGSGANQYVVGGYPCDMAVDAAHLYWINFTFAGGFFNQKGTIGRADLAGSAVNRGFIPHPGNNPFDVAVDGLRSFAFGKATRNKSRGTATLTINLPSAGNLTLATSKWVEGRRGLAEAAGKTRLLVRPTGEAMRKLRRTGRVEVKAEVTYRPAGGDPSIVASTDAKPLWLVRRKDEGGPEVSVIRRRPRREVRDPLRVGSEGVARGASPKPPMKQRNAVPPP